MSSKQQYDENEIKIAAEELFDALNPEWPYLESGRVNPNAQIEKDFWIKGYLDYERYLIHNWCIQ